VRRKDYSIRTEMTYALAVSRQSAPLRARYGLDILESNLEQRQGRSVDSPGFLNPGYSVNI
jgi:hypothetical protein